MRKGDKIINKQKKFFFRVVKPIREMNYYWFNRQEILQKAKKKMLLTII